MASIATEKTVECADIYKFVKRERQQSPEEMETGREEADSTDQRPFHSSFSSSGLIRNQQQQQQQQAGLFGSAKLQPQTRQQQGTAAAAGEVPGGRRTSADILKSLISPQQQQTDFSSPPGQQTGTPTSLSQLIPNHSSAFLEGASEFATPVGSGHFSPQHADRMTRKRPLSISPGLSSSSLDLNSLIRTSPTSLVNYITSSRGSSAGSFGHLSPSLYSNMCQQVGGSSNMHGTAASRPMQVSLRSGNFPVSSSTGGGGGGQNSFSGHHHHQQMSVGGSELDDHIHHVEIKKEMEMSPPSQNMSSIHHQFDSIKMDDLRDPFSFEAGGPVSIKMEPGLHDFLQPPPLISMGNGGLETVQEEPSGGLLPSEEEDLMHSDPMHSDPADYTDLLNGNECEYETKLGIIEQPGDSDKQKKRIYYTYPTVEEPHNNQCRWAECGAQCEDLEGLVQHVNADHIYRDSKKEFVCHWSGCVRERKPFKAQYMLLVHMRRHTGEKPHKCTYDGCFKAYSRLENLKTHLRSHTGERPYVCKYEGCGKAFSNASDCAKHMNRTHSDEKPYACPNPGCTKRYTDPSSRRKHMKNCQVKKPRPDPMSGADEESCPETCPVSSTTGGGGSSGHTPSSSSSKAKKASSKSRRKSSTSSINPPMRGGLSGDTGYGSGGSQPGGYVSGESQTGSQGGYTSYEDACSDYSGMQEDEISRILQEQRLSDPADLSGGGGPWGGVAPKGRGAHHHQHHHMQTGSSGGYHFHAFQTSPLSPPTQQYVPHLLGPTTSGSSANPQQQQQRQVLEMTAPNNAHHGLDFRNNHTPSGSSGYSSFRSSEKSPDDIDAASVISSGLRSNPMTTSLSTFSSNSSRVSSPCSTGDSRGVALFPGHTHMMGAGHHHHHHQQHQHRGATEMDVTGVGGFPSKHSLRNSYSQQPQQPRHAHQQQQQQGLDGRRHSDEMSNSSRAWTYSSQSSRYTDDILENLPNGEERRNSFSKNMPLPLPESMQQNFSPGSSGGYVSTGEQQGMGFRQGQQQGSSTMPLCHFDNSSDGFSGGSGLSQHLHDGPGVFSQESTHLSGDAYISRIQHHLSSPSNSLVSPGSNMVLGTMDTFSQALSEESQYYETMYSQVK